MILVDTSVWMDLFSGQDTPHVLKLESLIENQEDLCTCGVIMTEVLQGICNDQEYSKTQFILSGLIYLPMNQSIFIKSAKIYRELRKKGITIRKPIDCMIASVCLDHEAQLLHNDRDFKFIANLFPLQFTHTTEGYHAINIDVLWDYCLPVL